MKSKLLRTFYTVVVLLFFLNCANALPNPTEQSISIFKTHQLEGVTGRVAFSAIIDGKEQVFVLDADRNLVQSLDLGEGNVSSPQWSPDGMEIAFSSDPQGEKQLYVASFDGQNRRRLVNSKTQDDEPTWSPDGNRIAYSARADESTNLFLLDITAGEARRLTSFSGRNLSPSWAPEGDLIAFSSDRKWPNTDICVWGIARKSESCVVSGGKRFARPRYARDGKKLAYFVADNTSRIFFFSFIKGVATEIPTSDSKKYDLAWGPGDSFLIYSVGEEKSEIRLVPFPNGKERLLLSGPVPIRRLSWSPVTGRELIELKQIAQRTATPEPTMTNTATPTENPTDIPIEAPTQIPTELPTEKPIENPTTVSIVSNPLTATPLAISTEISSLEVPSETSPIAETTPFRITPLSVEPLIPSVTETITPEVTPNEESVEATSQGIEDLTVKPTTETPAQPINGGGTISSVDALKTVFPEQESEAPVPDKTTNP